MTIENIEIFEKLAKSSSYDSKINELVAALPLTVRDALLKADSQKMRRILAEREGFSDFFRVACVSNLGENVGVF